MSKLKRIIIIPSVIENAKIVAAAKADPDALPMTKAQLDAIASLQSTHKNTA
jgi:hypothetical protein